MKNFNLRKPLAHGNFRDLVKFGWDHGCGNKLTPEKNPTPWTSESLENAFLDYGGSVDQRTIQNWISGKNLPSRRNIYTLARVFSRDEEDLRIEWLDSLILARQVSLDEKKKTARQTRKPKRTRVPQGETNAPVNDDAKDPVSRFKKRGLALGLFLSLIVIVVSAITFLGDGLQKRDVKSIALLPLADLSSETNKNFFADSITEDIISGLTTISDLSVRSKTASKAYRNSDLSMDQIAEELDVNYLVEGSFRKIESDFILTVRLIDVRDGDILWADKFTESIDQLFTTEETIAENIIKALDIYIDEEKRQNMFNFGTRNVTAYENYITGRALLKNWHETSSGDDIWRALSAFEAATQADPSMAKAYFHSVDPYFHFAKGEVSAPPETIKVTLPAEGQSTQDIISDLLENAERHASNEIDAAQYRVNKIIFSNDWTGLREAAAEFGTLAARGTGELEWEFGPVALLITGEYHTLLDLVENRILKYDPFNGTGHTYAVRAHLLDAMSEKGHARLKAAKATTFSRRLEEVEAYLHFFDEDAEALKAHLAAQTSLTPSRKAYFSALAQSLEGSKRQALETLLSSPPLKADKSQLAIGLMHIGASETSDSLLKQLTGDWVEPLNFTSALAYGAGCGKEKIDLLPELEKRFSEAKIDGIPCANFTE